MKFSECRTITFFSSGIACFGTVWPFWCWCAVKLWYNQSINSYTASRFRFADHFETSTLNDSKITSVTLGSIVAHMQSNGNFHNFNLNFCCLCVSFLWSTAARFRCTGHFSTVHRMTTKWPWALQSPTRASEISLNFALWLLLFQFSVSLYGPLTEKFRRHLKNLWCDF